MIYIKPKQNNLSSLSWEHCSEQETIIWADKSFNSIVKRCVLCSSFYDNMYRFIEVL